jgi:hypothetical protein
MPAATGSCAEAARFSSFTLQGLGYEMPLADFNLALGATNARLNVRLASCEDHPT